MLDRRFRLRKKEDFDRVFRQGKPLFFGEIACRVAPNALPHLRVGFSFSKKYLPKAVSRNRLRRLLSESLALSKDQWPKTGADIVFFVVKKPASLTLDGILPVVSMTLEKLNK